MAKQDIGIFNFIWTKQDTLFLFLYVVKFLHMRTSILLFKWGKELFE